MAGWIKATREASDSRLASHFEYDVCLSFAGEDRVYVRQVASELRSRGVRIFYDEYEVERLWGKDLYEHLNYIYGKAARYCILFASKHYARKVWTSHERKSAQARALEQNIEYILPARFDSTSIPGLRETVGYIDLRRYKPHEFSMLVVKKLAPYRLLDFQWMEHYFPPNPDILFSTLKARSKKDRDRLYLAGQGFFYALSRMTSAERFAVYSLLIHGCPHDLPENVHIELDLLRRVTKLPYGQLREILSGLTSLGFRITLPKRLTSTRNMIHLRWEIWSSEFERLASENNPNFTHVAVAMVGIVARHYCEKHAIVVLERLNFSALSKSTAIDDIHS